MENIKKRWCRSYLEEDSHPQQPPPTYETITENLYLDKKKEKRKHARSMACNCTLTKEEKARGIMGCSDDCLNRMMYIECGSRCPLGEFCLNKRFQKCQSAKVEVFKTRKKGWGLRTLTDLPANCFIMEYVGEVVRPKEFKSRVKKYAKQKIKHHYFMSLGGDKIIDATVKGNLTRFINHSCEPNCVTQKWNVNGECRIGFFTKDSLQAGDEITFDYQFQRYGRKAQKCYCGTPSCRGYIGNKEQKLSLTNGDASPKRSPSPSFKIPRLSKLQRIEIEKKVEIKSLGEQSALELINPFTRNRFKPIAQPIKRKIPTCTTTNNKFIKHTIDDELAFSLCDYDEYYMRDRELTVDDVIDESNPYPGTYYTTPDGETWFVTITLDRKTQKPRTVILKLRSCEQK